MALTDAQFKSWLIAAGSLRTVLVEAVARIVGTETTLYLSSRNYITTSADTPASTAYQACISGGVSTSESLNLDGTPSMSWGDIEINNADGSRDGWLDYVWSNRAVSVYVGDPTWPRADFRLVFSGVIDDIGSRTRTTLNLRLRDKLERLNNPVSETVLGGSTANKDRLIPITLGDVFNAEPLLINPSTLTFRVSDGAIQDLHEVRDGGLPITSFTPNLAAGTFALTAAQISTITVTARGAKPGGTYANTVSALVQYLALNYGPASTRLSSGDLDSVQLAAFATACPQVVGLYMSDRANVLAVCQQLAASIGAQVVMTSTGLLRLIRIALPATGTVTSVTAADMEAGSISISSRPAVAASCKLGYARNYTPQTSGLMSGTPASSITVMGQEWQSVTSSDATTATNYKLDASPVLQETCLVVQSEASTEADRRRDLWKTQRTVYQATYLPNMMLTELGDAVTITHQRLGLSAGKTGIVVSIDRDWLKCRATIGVLA